MKNLVKVFKALADSNRIRIIKMLEVHPLCVCEITDILQLATSAVSNHLSILRDAGFIEDRKDGRWVDYHLQKSGQESFVRELLPLLEAWLPDDRTIQSDRRKAQSVDRNSICRT